MFHVKHGALVHNSHQTKSSPRLDLFHVDHSMPGASNGHLLDMRVQRRGRLIRVMDASAAFVSLAMLKPGVRPRSGHPKS